MFALLTGFNQPTRPNVGHVVTLRNSMLFDRAEQFVVSHYPIGDNEQVYVRSVSKGFEVRVSTLNCII